MSDSQKEHVASIEQFVPGLDSLRQKVCHELSDGQFWMIYFVLLLPRLNGNDLELLSTPEASFSLISYILNGAVLPAMFYKFVSGEEIFNMRKICSAVD